MSKTGNELERLLDENKYALYYALTKMWEGNEISENDETRVSVRVTPSSEAVLQARIVLDAIDKGGSYMNIYLSKESIQEWNDADYKTWGEFKKALVIKAANHAVREVFDYLNVKNLKVVVNRLLEVGLMIKEMDNE